MSAYKRFPFVQGWLFVMILIFFILVVLHYMGGIEVTNVSGIE